MKAAKAIVPIAIGLVFQGLEAFGVEIPSDFKASVIGLVGSILVWLVPNK